MGNNGTKENKKEQIGFRSTTALRAAVLQFANQDDRSEGSAICLLLKKGLAAEGIKVK